MNSVKNTQELQIFFVSMIENNNCLKWEYEPIDLNSYDPPKSAKDIYIDELNKLIENK